MAAKNSDNAMQAYQNLNIDQNHRIVLSLDGGGVRGILTLQLLKKLEEVAGAPCYEFCDLVAGTSTGAIIAGLIAFGKTASEIEQIYIRFVTKVFSKKSVFANRFVNPPAYDKANYRVALKEVLGDITLGQTVQKNGIDMLITAKNVTESEETYFTCFEVDGQTDALFKDALLRTVLEATMSAPTYFNPLNRFIDGGTTTYNNPSSAALLEAVCYSGKNKYQSEQLTVFSFGTGMRVLTYSPDEAIKPSGPDAYFWLNYVMNESSQDASMMQIDLLRSPLLQVDYRRFQISLDNQAMNLLPDRDLSQMKHVQANRLHDLGPADLKEIGLDDINKFELLTVIGQAMADYIMQKNKFGKDLNDTPTKRDELVTAYNGAEKIAPLVSQSTWIDGLPT